MEGGSEHHNNTNKFTNTALPHGNLTKHRHCNISPHLQTLDTTLLYLNSFPQNKHITMLVTATVLILLMPVNLYLYLKVCFFCIKSMNMTEKLTRKATAAK